MIWGSRSAFRCRNGRRGQRPPRSAMEGRFCRVEPLDPARHAADLHAANSLDREGRNWTYLPYGPFARLEDYRGWLDRVSAGDDPLFHAILDRQSGRAVGVASYMRIDPGAGVIEVGDINYSPRLAAHPGRDRGDVPDDAPGLRRARLSPLRVEMRLAERAVARRGAAPGLHL